MSALSDRADAYLRLRNSLGHDLADARRLLPRFVAYLDANNATITVAAALAWATQPDVDPMSSVWSRRMTAARGFARYMAGIDAATEIPPPGLIPLHQRWRPPFIYEPADIAALLAAARSMRWRLPAATHGTLIGLLAATGLRVGEALRLDRGDIDWANGVLLIRMSKFGKTRQVPVSDSTVEALRRYADVRDRLCPNATTPAVFVSIRATRLIYAVVQQVFSRLRQESGVGVGAPNPPRIHDFRHTFAVRTLLEWYRAGDDVEARLPSLSTYLGHHDPRSTYWYLSAAPELLGLAALRLRLSREVMAR